MDSVDTLFMSLSPFYDCDTAVTSELEHISNRVHELAPILMEVCDNPVDLTEETLAKHLVDLITSVYSKVEEIASAAIVEWGEEFNISDSTSFFCSFEKVCNRTTISISLCKYGEVTENGYEVDITPIRRWVITERQKD